MKNNIRNPIACVSLLLVCISLQKYILDEYIYIFMDIKKIIFNNVFLIIVPLIS